MRAAEVGAYLTGLARGGWVSASTQNQALRAILFLCKVVFGVEPGWPREVVRAERPRRLPVVLSRGEVRQVLGEMGGTSHLTATLMCDGCGRRDAAPATDRRAA